LYASQRHNTENSKQIFPEKELRGYSPNSYIHVSVSDLYITLIGLPILETGIEAAQFLFWKYINLNFFVVRVFKPDMEFFQKSVSPWPLSKPIRQFGIFTKIRGDIRSK
jgi:hypothetical protein